MQPRLDLATVVAFFTSIQSPVYDYSYRYVLRSITGKQASYIPLLAPTAKRKISKTRREKSRFHTHTDTSVAIMAVYVSLNISHFYNTERGNTDSLDCFPWTTNTDERLFPMKTMKEQQCAPVTGDLKRPVQ